MSKKAHSKSGVVNVGEIRFSVGCVERVEEVLFDKLFTPLDLERKGKSMLAACKQSIFSFPLAFEGYG